MHGPRFLTDDQGQAVEVVLDMDTYERLLLSQSSDPRLLRDFSREQLEALAKSTLTTAEESDLYGLIEKKKGEGLSADETAKLQGLLDQIDQLALIKARALYTLHKMEPLGTTR